MTDDLTKFQIDLLLGVALEEPIHGLGLKERLQSDNRFGYSTIHHGRLYPNLDTLVNKGLVLKGSTDERTNEYRLTDRGGRDIQSRFELYDSVIHALAANSQS